MVNLFYLKELICFLLFSFFFLEDVFPQSGFITTWEVTADDLSITIPTEGGGYDYTVDWGDEEITTNNRAS